MNSNIAELEAKLATLPPGTVEKQATEAAVGKLELLGGILSLDAHKSKGLDWCPLILDETVEYKEFIDEFGSSCFGTVKLGTQIPHGLIRSISQNSYIGESHFVDGKGHGFFRGIMGDGKHFEGYCKNGKRVGVHVTYNADNSEAESRDFGGL